VQAEARFCHACGTGLSGAARLGPWTAKTITLAAAFVAAVAAVTIAAGVAITQYKAAKAPAARPEQSIDISRLSPREAADQLFNRVMMAREQGDLAEARRFAPMAVEAYGRVAALDDDAHYHLGQIHVTAGDLESARREIAILRQAAPDHLLALILTHDVAAQTDDPPAARRAAAAFATAYAAEIATKRPEYEAHRTTIEDFYALTAEVAALLSEPALREAEPAPRAEAAAPSELAATAPPSEAAVALPGAALFDSNCARCHGREAAGGPGGPPLVHRIYEPGHHADVAFHLAVRQGVRAHHWSFGNMPAIPGLTAAEVDEIIAYVRALQVAAGIE
jgi:mono/diheme cytochrome c family protein